MPGRTLCAIACLTALSIDRGSTAKADDFTGLYGGVNAGYAFGRDRQNSPEAFKSVSPDSSSGNEVNLPPSAASAARAMKAVPQSSTTVKPSP
ncbi:MAG: hypothetical protein K2Y56_08435 [Methylobacterium sp.]|uniref:hypothetical protein n=1 Tax=Methylobacterium sp. TaxID=409 RepID=UPI0025DB5CC8|nr:hypothetical protein [Methylobacterium sp.]MBX9931553.1 hypothetical protein [Methylobacterium sp.]